MENQQIQRNETASRPPERLSETEVTTRIPVEKKRAIGEILDRWRLNLGWKPLDNDSQELAMQSWICELDKENIPFEAYNDLFTKALGIRAKLFANGKNAPDFGIELLIAAWIGGVRDEWRKRKVDQKRFLPEKAESVCSDCFGTGLKHRIENGKTLGIEGKCGCRNY